MNTEKKRKAAAVADNENMAAGQEKPVFNQIEYQNEYNRQKYDIISLTMPKGNKERLKIAAAAAGKSVTKYINEAIEKALIEDGR